jgi:hypothetical protein
MERGKWSRETIIQNTESGSIVNCATQQRLDIDCAVQHISRVPISTPEVT